MAARKPSPKPKRSRRAPAKPATAEPLPSQLLLPSRAASVPWQQRLTPLTRYQLRMSGVAALALAMAVVTTGLIHTITAETAAPKHVAAVTAQTHTLQAKLEAASRQLGAVTAAQDADGANSLS